MAITSLILLSSLSAIFIAETVMSASHDSTVPVNSYSSEPQKSNPHTENVTINLNYRLPNETYPEHYDIELATNIHTGEKSFLGRVIIDIVVVNATSNIVLHACTLEISKVIIANPCTAESEELLYEHELERDFLILKRKNDQQFAAETKLKLIITYSGNMVIDAKGFYFTKYVDDEGNKHYLAATQFDSTYARYAFPCYDEPDKRAKFTITIKHSSTYMAISNMQVNKALSSAVKTVFLTTSRIPTCIVAFIISDFEYIEAVSNGTLQRFYSRQNAKNKLEWALNSAMKIAKHLSDYYGVEFMLPKIDHVAVPGFSIVALDSLGLAIYNEKSLLYDKNVSTVIDQTNVAKAVAYEISRQWFGDFITIKWWTYLWLKECLAILIANRVLDVIYPEWDVWQEFHTIELQNALDSDGINSSRPITSYVHSPNDIKNIHDSVCYYSASSVLFMWNNALTDKIFQKGLRNLSNKNQHSAADEDQFFTALQNAVNELNYGIPVTIGEMMSTWTHQGGYPILTVTRNYEEDTFSVKQEAFYDDETLQNNKTWYVPINYVVASNPDFHDTEATQYLLNVTETKLHDIKISKNDWLILNKQSTGFYRINYDEENWNLIAEGLINTPFQIHVRNRAQLMHDAYKLCISNRLNHSILLKMLTYLKQEDQYAPWSTAYDILGVFKHYLSGDNEFNSFVIEQVTPIFNKLGVNEVPGEKLSIKNTRTMVLNMACSVGIKKCLDYTNNKLKALVERNIPIEPSLEESIYCNGLRKSGDKEFDFLYKTLMASDKEDLRSILISCLGYSQSENHIRIFIYSSIDMSNHLRFEERSSLLSSVYVRDEKHLLACIEFLNNNWEAYGNLKSDNRNSNPLDDDIRGMALLVMSRKQEEKLLALVAKVKNSNYVMASLETDVMKIIADNYHWLRKHGEPITSWLTQYRAVSNS